MVPGIAAAGQLRKITELLDRDTLEDRQSINFKMNVTRLTWPMSAMARKLTAESGPDSGAVTKLATSDQP